MRFSSKCHVRVNKEFSIKNILFNSISQSGGDKWHFRKCSSVWQLLSRLWWKSRRKNFFKNLSISLRTCQFSEKPVNFPFRRIYIRSLLPNFCGGLVPISPWNFSSERTCCNTGLKKKSVSKIVTKNIWLLCHLLLVYNCFGFDIKITIG